MVDAANTAPSSQGTETVETKVALNESTPPTDNSIPTVIVGEASEPTESSEKSKAEDDNTESFQPKPAKRQGPKIGVPMVGGSALLAEMKKRQAKVTYITVYFTTMSNSF